MPFLIKIQLKHSQNFVVNNLIFKALTKGNFLKFNYLLGLILAVFQQ